MPRVYDEAMKQFILMSALIAGAALVTMGASQTRLNDVKTVYMLPMSSGFDQYLAIRLTNGAVLQVVTDPQKADAVFTDHIGGAFEEKLDELYGQKARSEDDKSESSFSKPVTQSRARGAMFLVNRKTRDVIWSVYERPKDSTPDTLKRAADKVASQLEKDAKGK